MKFEATPVYDDSGEVVAYLLPDGKLVYAGHELEVEIVRGADRGEIRFGKARPLMEEEDHTS